MLQQEEELPSNKEQEHLLETSCYLQILEGMEALPTSLSMEVEVGENWKLKLKID